MQIITISPRGFGANTYVITADNKTAIVIDPAQNRVESELIKRGLTAAYVLLTHCHFDHVGGVGVLQESGAKVLCSAAEKPLVGTESDGEGYGVLPAMISAADMEEIVVHLTHSETEALLRCYNRGVAGADVSFEMFYTEAMMELIRSRICDEWTENKLEGFYYEYDEFN